MIDGRTILVGLLREPRFWARIAAALLFLAVLVGAPLVASRQSTAVGQDVTSSSLQRRQVVALERIASELAEANRNTRRCR